MFRFRFTVLFLSLFFILSACTLKAAETKIVFSPDDPLYISLKDDFFSVRILMPPSADRKVYVTAQDGESLLQKAGQGEKLVSYTGSFRLSSKTVKYYFRILEKEKESFYGPDGFSSRKPKNSFLFRSENEYNLPSWTAGAVLYYLDLDRFSNGDVLNDGKSRRQGRSGGDIMGVINNLPYLINLGPSGLVLSSPVPSTGYGPADFRSIDPIYGTITGYRQLIQRAGSAGIRILQSACFSCASYYHPYFIDVRKKGNKSEYFSWFLIDEWPMPQGDPQKWLDTNNPENPFFQSKADLGHLPLLNLNDPSVSRYLLDTGQYWITRTGIQGFFIDMPDVLPLSFLNELNKEISSISSEAVLLCNSGKKDFFSPPLRSASVNHGLRRIMIDFFAKHSLTPGEFAEDLEDLYQTLPLSPAAMINLLSDKENKRFLALCGKNKDSYLQALTFLLTSPGTPLLFWGEETGYKDPSLPFPWDASLWDKAIFDHVKNLISIRKKRLPLSLGIRRTLSVSSDLLVFIHEYQSQAVLTVFSFNDQEKSFRIDLDSLSRQLPNALRDELSNTMVNLSGNILSGRIEPYKSMIFTLPEKHE